MPQFCSHMGSKCMQCWVTSVISKRFAMLGSMLWVVLLFRVSVHFVKSSIVFSEENAWKYTFGGHSLPVSFPSWGCPSFCGLPWPASRQTPAQWGTCSNRNNTVEQEKKALLVFLDILKLNFLPSLLVVRVVTPGVQLMWAFVSHIILKSFLCQVASKKTLVEEEQLGRKLKDDNRNGQFVWSFCNLVIFPHTCLCTLTETADTRG